MAVTSLANIIYMDGIDLYTNFGFMVESGMAQFLQYGAKKDGISHDWQDSDGVEYDLSRIFLKDRTISLQCALVAKSEDEWITRHDSFLTLLRQPNLRRLEYTPHKFKQYFVFYKENTTYRGPAPLRNQQGEVFVGYKFTLTLVEPAPSNSLNNNIQEFLYAETQFIIA